MAEADGAAGQLLPASLPRSGCCVVAGRGEGKGKEGEGDAKGRGRGDARGVGELGKGRELLRKGKMGKWGRGSGDRRGENRKKEKIERSLCSVCNVVAVPHRLVAPAYDSLDRRTAVWY